jgi:GDP-L-fucose synthase
MSNKQIILFGSQGFLGKNLAQILPKGTLMPSRQKVDLRDFNKIKNFLKKIKNDNEIIIINCACHVGNVHYGSKYQADIIYDNSLISLNLYKACTYLKQKIKIINPFANCSYPANSNIQSEEGWLIGNVHESVISYGSYKRFLYALSKSFSIQYGIKSINWMFGGGYGPNASKNENKEHALNGMILRMIKAKKDDNKNFVVWGSGKPIREWVFIKDMAKILKNSINKKEQIYPINFGQRKGYSIKKTATIIKKILNYKGKLVFDKTKKDGDKKKVLDNKNFKKKIKNFKFTALEKGIRETIKYYS